MRPGATIEADRQVVGGKREVKLEIYEHLMSPFPADQLDATKHRLASPDGGHADLCSFSNS